MIKVENMTDEQVIAFLNGSGKAVPAWMLDMKRMRSNEKLTETELFEFAEFHSSQLRTNAALRYLRECIERFGRSDDGGEIFVHENVVMQIDQHVIETLLQHQVEAPLLEERPKDRYVTVMQFYQMDELNRKETDSTWMRDFIDSVFIEGANAMLEGEAVPEKNLH
ncbi:hypothetical protein [Serratia fonticola]